MTTDWAGSCRPRVWRPQSSRGVAGRRSLRGPGGRPFPGIPGLAAVSLPPLPPSPRGTPPSVPSSASHRDSVTGSRATLAPGDSLTSDPAETRPGFWARDADERFAASRPIRAGRAVTEGRLLSSATPRHVCFLDEPDLLSEGKWRVSLRGASALCLGRGDAARARLQGRTAGDTVPSAPPPRRLGEGGAQDAGLPGSGTGLVAGSQDRLEGQALGTRL